jgi:hypothetical protein
VSRPTALKLVFLLTGLVVFGYGVREDLPAVRWWGIGLMAVALLLRLVSRRRRPDEGEPPIES